MKSTAIIIITFMTVLFNTSSYAVCSEGSLRFSFENLEVKKAFALFADYAGLKAKNRSVHKLFRTNEL